MEPKQNKKNSELVTGFGLPVEGEGSWQQEDERKAVDVEEAELPGSGGGGKIGWNRNAVPRNDAGKQWVGLSDMRRILRFQRFGTEFLRRAGEREGIR